MKIEAPWTDQQVKALNKYQTCEYNHPFTCGNEGCNHVTLIAITDGWICPKCKKWVQTWAWDFMTTDLWKQIHGVCSPESSKKVQDLLDDLETFTDETNAYVFGFLPVTTDIPKTAIRWWIRKQRKQQE